MKFTLYNKVSGKVFGVVDCDSGHIEAQTSNGTYDYLAGEFLSHYIENISPVPIPQQSSEHHVFNWQTKQWEDPRTLDDLKAAQWTLIKQARSQAEYAGFTWDGSTFDSDAISQSRITGVVTLANLAKQLEQPYSITWTLADNSTRTLSADEMILVGLALGQHVQTNFNKGQQLYEQIQQAITKEEVEAVLWPN